MRTVVTNQMRACMLDAQVAPPFCLVFVCFCTENRTLIASICMPIYKWTSQEVHPQSRTYCCASCVTNRRVIIVFVLGVSSVSPCQHNEFLCRSTNQCIASSLTCNDVRDCDDGSDEDDKLANCAGAKQTVHANICICMLTFRVQSF